MANPYIPISLPNIFKRVPVKPRPYIRGREFVTVSVGGQYTDTHYTTLVAMVRLHDPFQEEEFPYAAD